MIKPFLKIFYVDLLKNLKNTLNILWAVVELISIKNFVKKLISYYISRSTTMLKVSAKAIPSVLCSSL